MVEIIRAHGARSGDLAAEILEAQQPLEETLYIPMVVPTIDAHASGVFEQRVRSAICVADFVSIAAGRMDARVIVRPQKGFAMRIMRAQAFVYDSAAANDWYDSAARTVDRIIIGHGHVGRLKASELELVPDVDGNANISGTPNVNQNPVPAPRLFVTQDELAAGTDRITYEPPNGLVIARPSGDGGDTEFDADHGIFAAYTRTAVAGAEADALALMLTYHVSKVGAYPPR